MITSEKFDLLKYHFFRSTKLPQEITFLKGFDSEADATGKPFLFCFENGQPCTLENVFETLFLPENVNQHYGVWNLKYDSGALLYELPPGAIIYDETGENIIRFQSGLRELWKKGETFYIRYQDAEPDTDFCLRQATIYFLKYIPHKYLKISLSKDKWVKFWDICQFYAMGLDKAARRYLNDKKIEVKTKTFTPEYIKRNRKKLIEYCTHDANLTSRLGNLLLEKVKTFGVTPTALYSQASLSFSYFQEHTEIIGIQRFWKHYPNLCRVGMDAYAGGKFELTARGKTKGFEYDIISAYPYEIANLADITLARVTRSKKREPSAYYGFLRVHIKIYESVYLPVGLLIDNTRVYAIGEYYATITLAEYLYMETLGVEMKILDAYYFFIDNPEYPYRACVNALFDLKSKYKGNDAALYSLMKTMINGFYGKFCQVIDDWEGNYNAGIGFNPFYAAVITANTRIKVSRVQNDYKADCLGVHTDSVFMRVPLDKKYMNNGAPGLGDFELVDVGTGSAPADIILIACGCYQIADTCAFKGLESVKDDDWISLLTRYKNKTEIPYKNLRVESWVEATAKGHFDKINLFQTMPKDLLLNADIKRVWQTPPAEMKGKHYLQKLYRSEPRIIVENEIPEYWQLKKATRN